MKYNKNFICKIIQETMYIIYIFKCDACYSIGRIKSIPHAFRTLPLFDVCIIEMNLKISSN